MKTSNSPTRTVRSIHHHPPVSQNTLQLLTGVTMGSSFIGMVHMHKQEKSSSSQSMATIAGKAQA